MSTCPRCGANHVRKLDPRGRPGGDVDCTTWWCPRGHKWREVGHGVGPERMGPGSVLVSDDRYGAGWAKPALVLAGRIYRYDGNMYRARDDADTDWLRDMPDGDGAIHYAAPPPLPRPERVEPWQVWLDNSDVPALVVASRDIDHEMRSMDGVRWFAASGALVLLRFLGRFKPRIGSRTRTWTFHGPLVDGWWNATDAQRLDTTDDHWLPKDNPTDADIAEWRETWGKP